MNNQPPLTALTIKDIESMGTLAEAKEKLAQRDDNHILEVSRLLNSVLISAERWVEIVKDMADGNDPLIQQAEADELVAKQLIVRTYRLGGES